MAVYNSNIQIDVQRAKERLNWLIKKGKTFEIIEKRPIRSISQNNYLHLILDWFAWEYGEKKDHVKQHIFKKIVNPEIFKTEYINKRTGEVREDWRSSASLNTKEMTIAIDRFRDYASIEAGIYLPAPNEKQFLAHIDKELKNYGKRYI